MHIYENQWEQIHILGFICCDILLTTNNTDMLVETKQLLFNYFDMKDLGETSYVMGI